MVSHTNDPDVLQMREAAEMAVYRLYGFLGAGVRLAQALESLAGTQRFVASPYLDRMVLFKVCVLEKRHDDPVLVSVALTPSDDCAFPHISAYSDAPGAWTAVLQAARVKGPFTLVSLTADGKALALDPSPSQVEV